MTNTPQRTATILAALRFYQARGPEDRATGGTPISDIASAGGRFAPLGDGDIDDLCEELNVGGPPRPPHPSEAWDCLDYVVSIAKDSHENDRDEGLSGHPENDSDCYECQMIALAETVLAGMRDSELTVEILGGVLSDVSGLLPGQTYTLIDHDENGDG